MAHNRPSLRRGPSPAHVAKPEVSTNLEARLTITFFRRKKALMLQKTAVPEIIFLKIFFAGQRTEVRLEKPSSTAIGGKNNKNNTKSLNVIHNNKKYYKIIILH
jgi:hypothetical protein